MDLESCRRALARARSQCASALARWLRGARLPIRAGIDTESQGEEIAKLLYFNDLRDVVLVGTSSGGMVLACAAEQARERVARVVFVDALALFTGEKVSDFLTVPGSVTTPFAHGRDARRMGQRGRPRRVARSGLARLGRRPLHAVSAGGVAPARQARTLLGPVMERLGNVLQPISGTGQSAYPTHRRQASRTLSSARHLPLSDVERARRTHGFHRLRLRRQCAVPPERIHE